LRECREKPGKYIALLLFLTLSIALVSGFLEADNSIRTAYNSSFSRDRIEDGHFTTSAPLSSAALKKIRGQHMQTEPLYYKQAVRQKTNGKAISGKTQTWRVFKIRKTINKQEIFSGHLPKTAEEIAIDRCYASYHNLKTGSRIRISGKNFTVSALIALPDYSALFKNNTDMMFDAANFNVALVNAAGFKRLNNLSTVYCRSWRYTDRTLSQHQITKKDKKLTRTVASSGAVLTDLVTVSDNSAIQFTGEDMGSDKGMMIVLLYLIMIILAFIQAVSARSSIESEASAIGTLRASGFTRGEILRHYLKLPLLATLAAAVIGNLLGYTWMQKYMAAAYYHSYSLVPYTLSFSWNAFLLTTVIPCLIVLAVTAAVLYLSLRLPPLQFLRHDFHRKSSSRNAVRLPGRSFTRRMQMRVILHNKAAYLALFAGILFATILLVFGMSLKPMLQNIRGEILNSKIADYQYILKAPAAVSSGQAEKYAVTTLRWNGSGRKEEFTIYGISGKSSYLPDVSRRLSSAGKNEVLVSDGIMKKFGLSRGDKITLKNSYTGKVYHFKVRGVKSYPASMAVFMNRSDFNQMFGHSSGWFNGYFSNRKLSGLGNSVAGTITKQDLTLTADQMELSMGDIYPVFAGFAFLLYMIILYLLTRQIIERNASSISMMKVLGFEDREISAMYNRAAEIVTALSLAVSVCVSPPVLQLLYAEAMKDINGWLEYYMPKWMLPFAFAFGMICCLIISWIERRRIRKIPIGQVLKNNV
ncbi:MAG: FtsX-like permease family protein, partial [Eubacterium sp.]